MVFNLVALLTAIGFLFFVGDISFFEDVESKSLDGVVVVINRAGHRDRVVLLYAHTT